MHNMIELTAQGLVGEGRLQLEELALAFVLSSLVGLEREIRQKSAGLRTHTLVGVSAALFMLISKYGFMDVLDAGKVVLDPSRVAAQIVSGIGFIGGGVIFMRQDVVRGLTTAASIWFTAALGMACGAGLPILAIATTVAHFVVMVLFPRLLQKLPRSQGHTTELSISYEDSRGLLRTILVRCTELRFAIDGVRLEGDGGRSSEEILDEADYEGTEPRPRTARLVTLSMKVHGNKPVSHLITGLSAIDGVHEVRKVDTDPD
ncbi:MgtC/SapB family protein [Gluconobacter morbifer]|nr:MgtC/SapB family protein [Gluconobacter morbifer]